MIGNDIVDLALAQKESNWKRIGFLNKIFTKQEQKKILASENKEVTIWNLWSRKEATYKIYNRETGIRAYIPLQIDCFDLEIVNEIILGKVICNNFIYYTKTEITSDFIHTIAVSNIELFDAIYFLDNSTLVKKNKGIPYIINNKSTKNPVSISHHGQFQKIISC